jgi:hypothetical protein
VIDGSQTNREAILSCDTTNRLQDRSRRKLKPIRIRQSRYLNNPIGDVTLTGNTGLYSSRKNRVPRKISDLACAKTSLSGLLNDYTQLM